MNRHVYSHLLTLILALGLAGSACKSAVYDNGPTAIASASPAPSGTVSTSSIVAGAVTPEKLSQAYLPLAGGTMTGTLTLAGAPVNALDAATKAYVDSAISGVSGGGVTTAALSSSATSSTAIAVATSSPSGAVIAWAGTSAPTGWLLCDGTAVSRTTYATLFAAIGITHGQGDGSTTFNVPDYRGRFLRGTDNMGTGAAARDPDSAGRTAMNTGGNTANAVGSIQTDAFRAHTHNIPGTNFLANAGTGVGSGTSYGGDWGAAVLSTGGNETRPINAYVNYIIKY